MRIGEKWSTKEQISQWKLHLSLLILLFLCTSIALCVGKYSVSISDCLGIIFFTALGIEGDWPDMMRNVILNLRLPRVLAAIVVGASLSISGATYQGLFQNPLISPDFLGVSSGACIGAATAILLSLGSAYIQLFAFLGGITAVAITTAIPKLLRSNSNIMLVLSGIIVSGAMGSILGLLKYIADPMAKLAAITYWQMGSLSYIQFPALLSVLPPIIVSMVFLVLIAWWINIISLGEKDAQTLGANIKRIRSLAILAATLLTACSVSISGTIGWIGLVIPHFGRMIAGSDNRRLIPASALLGAIFLLFVDTVGRTVGSAELPLSILTGIIGAPFYAWLLYRTRTKLN